MAPSRGKSKAAANSQSDRSRNARRTTRSRTAQADNVTDVYSSMLAEASDEDTEDEQRPLKKRRVAIKPGSERPAVEHPHSSNAIHQIAEPRPISSYLQTVEDSSESENSDLDFEDVDLENHEHPISDPAEGIEDLAISLEPESATKRAAQPRRKPATTVEKTHRLLVHKMHVLCLLGHCMYVNGRCNNAAAQRQLRSLLSSKTLLYLKPKPTDSQFQQNRSFMDGLQQAVDSFTGECRVDGSGMLRPHWIIDGSEAQFDVTDVAPFDRSDFIEAAKSLEGSQDLASQLFCCMLRSAGVDARIVCSLQPLPFATVPKASTPKKPEKTKIMAIASDIDPTKHLNVSDDTAINGSRSIGSVPSVRRRLGQPGFAVDPKTPTPKKKKAKAMPKLQYPVFWVEAFNTAQQKWTAVDPIVTNTVNKPTKIEPPASYELNQLTYAIAFEEDGTARDVTRRYAKAYNAKTRRYRVESSVDGAKWWKKAMRFFRRRGGALDREQVEDSELAQKEAREGMPANILDFKDHPYYALERHLKRHEVLHPKREVGKVNAGTAAKPRMEPVYRRQDVMVCKSADKWYRVGRITKAGEQPLKHVPNRAIRQRSPDDDAGASSRAPTTGLYAANQTEQYVPAPVQRGRIPRNRYGNLDVYVPSMVPAGGRHIRHPLTKQAAQILRVDSADAVTGFSFKGRQGTAIVEGAVVPEQYADAVEAVIDGLEYEALEEQSRARSLLALKAWKRFLTGLKIAERVKSYGDGKEGMTEDENGDETALTVTLPEVPESDNPPLLTAGRFSLDELSAVAKRPKTRKRKAVESDNEEDFEASLADDDEDYPEAVEEGGGFIPDPDADYMGGGGFMPASDAEDGSLLAGDDEQGVDDGGGFIVPPDERGVSTLVDDGDDGGGFIRDYELGTDDGSGAFIQEDEGEDDLFGEGRAAEDDDLSGGGLLVDEGVESAERQPTLEAMQVDRTIDEAEEEVEPGEEEPKCLQPTEPNSDGEEQNATEHASSDDSMPLDDPEDDDAEPDWLE